MEFMNLDVEEDSSTNSGVYMEGLNVLVTKRYVFVVDSSSLVYAFQTQFSVFRTGSI